MFSKVDFTSENIFWVMFYKYDKFHACTSKPTIVSHICLTIGHKAYCYVQDLFNGAVSKQKFKETQQLSLSEEEAVPASSLTRSCNNLSSLVRSNVPPLLSVGDCDITKVMAGSKGHGISESSKVSHSSTVLAKI